MAHKAPSLRSLRLAGGQPTRRFELRPNAAARGYDWVWQKLAKRFLAAHPLCEPCLAEGRDEPATIVDHRIPVVVDPAKRLDEANLQPICQRHHAIKTAEDLRAGRGPRNAS